MSKFLTNLHLIYLQGPSKESQKDDSYSQLTDGGGGGTGGYDPTDMVVDMDMSDEDLDDIFRGLLNIFLLL